MTRQISTNEQEARNRYFAEKNNDPREVMLSLNASHLETVVQAFHSYAHNVPGPAQWPNDARLYFDGILQAIYDQHPELRPVYYSED